MFINLINLKNQYQNDKSNYRGTIKTSIVTAFTIATALIWKDVIIETIEALVPPSEALAYKLIVAILATIISIIAIYIILKTESKTESIFRRFKREITS